MRKLLLLALATGTLVLLQRHAKRMGVVPALILTAAAEKGLGLLSAEPPPPPKASLWRRMFPAKAEPAPTDAPASEA